MYRVVALAHHSLSLYSQGVKGQGVKGDWTVVCQAQQCAYTHIHAKVQRLESASLLVAMFDLNYDAPRSQNAYSGLNRLLI